MVFEEAQAQPQAPRPFRFGEMRPPAAPPQADPQPDPQAPRPGRFGQVQPPQPPAQPEQPQPEPNPFGAAPSVAFGESLFGAPSKKNKGAFSFGSNKRTRYNGLELGAYQRSSYDGSSVNGGKPEPAVLYSWRSDPATNLSDWTIVVTSKTKAEELSSSAFVGETNSTNDDDTSAVGSDKKDQKEKEQLIGDDDEKEQQQPNVPSVAVVATDSTKPSTSTGTLCTTTTTTTTTTYNVHKAIIGLGPRGSQYFLNMFRTNGMLAETQSSTSRLELEPSAAVAFPIMLDFMYHTDNNMTKASGGGFGEKGYDVNATTETAVALRHLANYFEVPSLFEAVNEFIGDDMDKDNIDMYLEEALLSKTIKFMKQQ